VTWSRLVPGAALLLAVAAAVATSHRALVEGHWAYPALLLVAFGAGLALLLWGVRGRRPERGGLRAVLRWAGALAGLGVAAVVWWLAPYPATALPTVAVQQGGSGIWMGPQEAPVGVAFIPGALVDPRAYETLFAPIAEAGYPVYIAKPPLGLAFGVPDVVAQARSAVPGVQQWVVAGHSLGGAVASEQTAGAAGLILLGAYPINDISDADVPVLSITAGNDTLTTPADVESSVDRLPAGTVFVPIDGGIHAYFGDYGAQRGDGVPTISREQQQAQAQQAMLQFLGSVG
jgi:hypothetical protein